MKNILPLLLICGACSTMKEPPSINLKINNVEGKYEMSDCEEEWDIARLEGLPNKSAEKKINSFLMSKVTEKSCDHADDVAGQEYKTKITAEKILPNFIVIEDTETFHAGGGAGPQVTASCIVFDLNTGDKIEFEKLLAPDYKKVADQLVVDQIWGGKAADAEEYKLVLSASNKSLVEITSPKVCPSGKGLVLQFPTLEIAPASFKNPEILVDSKNWRKIFKVNSTTKELFGDF